MSGQEPATGVWESRRRRTLLTGVLLFAAGVVLFWLIRSGPSNQTAPIQTPAPSTAPGDQTAERSAGPSGAAGESPSNVVTERPEDSEFRPVQQVKVNETVLKPGDPFDYIAHLFKSVNRLGQPEVAPDPDLPGSIVVTHVYVNYDRSILKVRAKRKVARGPFLITDLWVAAPRK